MRKIPAIIIGGGVTALGVIRALGQYKVPSFLDCAATDKIRHSRWYRHLNFLSDDRTTIDFDKLAALPFEKMVLIPCADPFVTQVLNIPLQHKARFLVSTCSHDALSKLVDKAAFAQQVELCGVQAPRTHIINSVDDLDSLPDSSFDNAFLKPTRSLRFMSAFGVKAMRVQSRTDAKSKLAKIHKANCDVVLQKYIPGRPSDHYFIDGFIDRLGDVKAVFARRRWRIYPRDFGNSSFMTSVALTEVDNAVEDIKSLLKSLNYRGIFSAEFKRDESDGELKIIEVNARAWWYVSFAADCGVNTPWMAYLDAQSLQVPGVSYYPENARCVYPYYDLHAYREKLTPELSFLQMLTDWFGARQPIFRWSDPLPAVMMSLSLVKDFFRKSRS